MAVSLSSSRSEPPSASSRTRLCRANRNSSCEIGQRNWTAEEYAWTELRDGRGEKVAPQPQLGDLQHAEESDQVRVLLQADAELRLLDDLHTVQHISRSIQTGPQFNTRLRSNASRWPWSAEARLDDDGRASAPAA